MINFFIFLFFWIDLQVTFEYDTPDGNHWSESVTDLEVKDQMVSFRTPRFPFPIDTFTTVDVILKQRKRTLEPLKFAYISIGNKKIIFCPLFQIIFYFSTMSTMSKKCFKQSKSNYTNQSK